MNEIRRPLDEADEIAQVRSTMDRFSFPEFVVGYTVKLGEFDDEPAVWIRFETNHRFPHSKDEMLSVGKLLSDLSMSAYAHLRENVPGRQPYFRFGAPESRD